MNRKNRTVRNKFIAGFIRLAAVILCIGAALSGVLYAWAQMRYMMSGVKTDTVDFSIFEVFGGEDEKDVVN